MSGLIWVLEAVLLGCLLVCRFTDLPAVRLRWARLLLIVGAGAAGGIGLTSCLYFLAGALLGVPAAAVMVVELAAAAWTGYEVYRRRIPVFASAGEPGSPLLFPITAGVLLLALGLATGAMTLGWGANPQGNWDAWAIWNLRAKFLASSGGLAPRAWSPALGAITHAEYPLLLSAFVGRCWAFAHSSETAVPAATAYVFLLALLALAAGGIAALRGPTLGILTALALAATPSLLHEVLSQYADVPLACYFAGALVFALLDRPVLAGVFAAFAAWTKDEGVLFLVVLLVAVAVFRRRAALATVAGAMPVAALVIFFKAVLAKGNASLLSASAGGAGGRVADLGRFGAVITAFGRELLGMATGWYHPILPLLVLAVALRFAPERRRDTAFSGAVLGTLLLGYFGVYLVTANNLAWQLQTSLNRLLVQMWPLLVLTILIGLRAPEASAVIAKTAPPQPAKAHKKSRR